MKRTLTGIVIAAVLMLSPACSGRAREIAVPAVLPTASDGPEYESILEPEATPAVVLPPAPAADLLALQAEMEAAIEDYGVSGRYAIAVTDLQTGETVSVNGAEPHLSGCVMNLFVIFQVARDLEAGRYGLEEADALIAATTWSSNAATARQLYELAGAGDTHLGVERVDELIREVLKLDAVLLDHPPLYHAYSLGRDYNNWITAEAVNEALAAFWRGDVVGIKWRQYVLDHLAEVKAGLNYLTASAPEGVVSHKNGFLEADTGFVDNDAGIVRLERDGAEIAYALTFLSEEVPWKYGDVVLGQKLSKLAYDVMLARYP